MKNLLKYLPFLFLFGCAGYQRSCASGCATQLGADWIVVQYKTDGDPINCWKLTGSSISNEQGTDGIYWLDDQTNNLVHISGWYNRVQVERNDFDGAAKLIGVDMKYCKNGKYIVPTSAIHTLPEQTITP